MFSTKTLFFMSTFVLLLKSAQNAESTVKVSIYYESLCPDSIDFIKNQLWPNYKNLQDSITVDFVPYGFANQSKDASGSWTFSCQHGFKECRGNKYQACAFDQQKGQNSDVAFVNCVMESDDPSDANIIQDCASENEYDWSVISKCYDGDRGSELIAGYGDRTKKLNPVFIPSIVFNDQFNQTLQDESIDNFLKAVCSQITKSKPDVCDS